MSDGPKAAELPLSDSTDITPAGAEEAEYGLEEQKKCLEADLQASGAKRPAEFREPPQASRVKRLRTPGSQGHGCPQNGPFGVIRTCAWLVYLLGIAVEKLAASRPPRGGRRFGDLSRTDQQHIDTIIAVVPKEFGSELRSTVQLSLESCAAEARVSLEVASFLDPSVGSEVHRTLLRTQKAHSGWLLLLDAAEAPLQRLIPKDHLRAHTLWLQGPRTPPFVEWSAELGAGQHPGPRRNTGSVGACGAPGSPSPWPPKQCFHTLLQQRGRLGGSRWSFADLTFATEVLARCLKPGQPHQEATQTLLAGIYVDCRLANHGFVEALALDFSFAGPLEPLEVLLPAELWSQLGDSVGIEDLCGFLEVAQESWRPGTGRDESMLQALLCVPDSVLVQHASPDLHFRLRPTACCLLEAVAHGMDCATQPDEKSDPFLLRRLEDRLRDGGGERRFGGLQGLGDVMADLVPCLKDLWPVDGEKGDAVWQTLLRELQRYNVWQRAVAQTLEATDRVLRMAQQERLSGTRRPLLPKQYDHVLRQHGTL
eukprot:s1817_g9.t1